MVHVGTRWAAGALCRCDGIVSKDMLEPGLSWGLGIPKLVQLWVAVDSNVLLHIQG